MNKKIMISFFLFLFSFLSINAQVLFPIQDSIPMRDGKKLAADIYIPSGTVQRPTILIQTPYNKLLYTYAGLPVGVHANINASPYNFVILDWRCFYGSTSACVTQPNRGQDGYDVVEWIAAQAWSDGKIGTWGPSALGKIQFMTAKENPPHFVCAVPIVAAPQYEYKEYFPGGVYRTEYVEQLDALGYGMSTVLLANPVYNFTWQYAEGANYYPDSIRIPMFMIDGWYDHAVEQVLPMFAGLRSSSPASVRDKHKLLMGPWTHSTSSNGSMFVGSLTFPNVAGKSDSLARKFFDFYLLNIANGWNTRPYVEYFQMGENTWHNDTAWYTGNLINYNFYFHKTGLMDINIPASVQDSSLLFYDAHNPSPTIGGTTLRVDLLQGPYDQAAQVESRNDILVFTTDVLTQNVKMRGKAQVYLKVSSDKLDTDFSVRLTDVYPNDSSILISDGIFRMRFLNGFRAADSSTITPGNIYAVTIDLPNTAQTFLAGHRIRVDVTSSNYPRFDCNLSNGQQMYVAGDTLIANNVVYLNSINSSYITLPLENFSSGINELENSSDDIFISPNPANHFLEIENRSTAKNQTLQLFDVDGKKIFEKKNMQSSQRIDVSNFSNGIYLLNVISEKGTITKKFSVMH